MAQPMPIEAIPGGAATQVAQQSGNPRAVGLSPEQAQMARDMVTPQEPIPLYHPGEEPSQALSGPPEAIPEATQEEPQETKLQAFKKKYPQYDKVADEELTYRLWDRHYKDRIPDRNQFNQMIGYRAIQDMSLRDKGRMFTQGSLVGFGEEATAGLAAVIAKVATFLPGQQAGEDSTLGDMYRDVLSAERYENERIRKDHPIQALAYEVAGGLASGGVGALRATGTTLATKTAIGAGWGGAYGAGAADPEESGLAGLKERGIGAAKGAAIGAVATPALVGAGKVAGKGYQAVKNAGLEKRLKSQSGRLKFSQQYQDEIYRNRALGDAPNVALEKANKKFNVTNERLMDLEVERGKLFESAGVSQQQAMDKLAAEKLVKKMPLQSGVMKEWDQILEPIYNRIEKHSPRLAQKLRNYEAQVYADVHNWHTHLEPYIDRVRKQLSKEDKAIYGQMLYNGDFEGAKKLLVASTKGSEVEIRKQFDDAMRIINHIGKLMKKEGAGFDEAPNYYPRRIRDLEGLKKYLGTQSKDFANDFKPWVDALGGKGGHREGNALNAYLRGTLTTKIKETSRRNRKVKELDAEMYKYYEDPVASVDLFLRDAASAIRRRQLLKGHVIDDPKTKVELTDKSIDSLIESFTDLSGPAQKEVADLLKARFGAGERGMSKTWSDVRAIAHNSLLGDVVSASTQLADIGVSAWNNGLYNTIRAVIGKNKVTADDLGIMREMVSEISDPGSLQRVTDKIFRWSGFRTVDKLGKNVAINSTLKKYTRMASSPKGKAKLHAELKPYWGDDTAQLMANLEKGEITDLTKQFLFSKLSDMQPISRSEMPEVFLNNPNGRIFYQLGTWTMKQLSLFRNTAWADMRSGDPVRMAKGLKNTLRAGLLIGGANVGSEEVKRFITGRDSAFTGNEDPMDIAWMLLKHSTRNFTGLSEYSTLGSISIPTGEVGGKLFLNYMGALEEMINEGAGEKTEKALKNTVRQLPIIGKMAYYHGLGGAEEFNKKQRAKEEAAGLSAYTQ